VETTVLAEIAAKERELKTLKIDLDKKENELTQKNAAVSTKVISLSASGLSRGGGGRVRLNNCRLSTVY
jgi:hypothetical protein